jgi:hypothetical protein
MVQRPLGGDRNVLQGYFLALEKYFSTGGFDEGHDCGWRGSGEGTELLKRQQDAMYPLNEAESEYTP